MLLRASESRQDFDGHRPVGEAVGKGFVVLLRQQRRRHQHRHLPAAADRREGRAQRDLGLAEADVAADQPVHGFRAGEIGQHVVDGARLVLGEGELKAGRERLVAAADRAAALRPGRAARFEYSSSNSAATSRMRSAARRRAFCHWSVPSRCSGACSGAAPV